MSNSSLPQAGGICENLQYHMDHSRAGGMRCAFWMANTRWDVIWRSPCGLFQFYITVPCKAAWIHHCLLASRCPSPLSQLSIFHVKLSMKSGQTSWSPWHLFWICCLSGIPFLAIVICFVIISDRDCSDRTLEELCPEEMSGVCMVRKVL